MELKLLLLGGGRVLGAGREPLVLDPPTAALLALLAFETSVSSASAARLLWPHASDKTSRDNLRQLLGRLREAAGCNLVEGSQALQLAGFVEVDALGGVQTGELLAGHAYDDCPALADWVRLQRDQCRAEQLQRLNEGVLNLERRGDLRAALELARELAQAAPASERAHKLVIRLCRALGDLPAALRAAEVARGLLDRLTQSLTEPAQPQSRSSAATVRVALSV